MGAVYSARQLAAALLPGGKIVANAEDHSWIELDYKGKLLDVNCDLEDVILPSELPCAKTFLALTHDHHELGGKLAKKLDDGYSEPIVLTGPKHTLVMVGSQLHVLGDNLKLKSSVKLNELPALEGLVSDETQLIKVVADTAWILYSGHLLAYNYNKKLLLKDIDLEEYEPHQAIVDGNRLWMISRKDGKLYGFWLNR